MKKILTILMAMLVIAPFTMQADNNKKVEKANAKLAKEKMKQLKKEKWTIFGSTNTLENALFEHYNKLSTIEGAHEITGVATNFQSKNLGKQAAYNNACFSYAQECGSDLRGMVIGMIEHVSDLELDDFQGSFERTIQKEIRGEMKESFSIIRTLPDGTMEIQTFFVIDEKSASNARLRAIEAALKENEAARKYSKEIHEFLERK